MSNKTDPQQGAFACASDDGYQQGLTKREYFAAMAMQGICSNKQYSPYKPEHFENAAEDAIRQADALIKALNE